MTMTQEQLEALMRATGTEGYPSDVRRLVEAVQAAERERCAKLCEQWDATHPQRLAALIRTGA
jgi:hypothetical protein